jgi:exopolysaccharide production protein ExoQ
MNESANQSGAQMNSPSVLPVGVLPRQKTGRTKAFAWTMDWERLFVIATLVFSTGAFVTLLPGDFGLEDAAQGEKAAQVIWSIIYLITIKLIWKRRQEFFTVLKRDKFLLALVGWGTASFLWSLVPSVTARHSLALIGTLFFGVYLTLRFDLRQRLNLIFLALAVTIAASLIACILFPDYGIAVDQFTDEKSWQGVFSHKNELAGVIVFAVMTLSVLKKGVIKLLYLPVLVGAFVLTLATRAMTSIVYFPLALLTTSFARRFQYKGKARKKLLVLVFVAIVLCGYGLYYNWENITESLGKDPNMSGRVLLWVLSIPQIAQRPIAGYGLDGFWYDQDGPAGEIRSGSGWLEAPNAHNGIINLWLDLGLIGVFLFLTSYSISLSNTVRLMIRNRSPETIWYLVFLLFLFLYSLTETSFMIRNDFFWILYISTAVAVRGELRQNRSIPAAIAGSAGG